MSLRITLQLWLRKYPMQTWMGCCLFSSQTWTGDTGGERGSRGGRGSGYEADLCLGTEGYGYAGLLLRQYQEEGEAFLAGTENLGLQCLRLCLCGREAPGALSRMQGARMEV